MLPVVPFAATDAIFVNVESEIVVVCESPRRCTAGIPTDRCPEKVEPLIVTELYYAVGRMSSTLPRAYEHVALGSRLIPSKSVRSPGSWFGSFAASAEKPVNVESVITSL